MGDSDVDVDIDALLAAELNQMTFKEREKMYEEIHGVDVPVAESEELITSSLEELDRELQAIAVKPAYLQALQQNPEYIHSRKFRLMFLRAESFHPAKAASRLVRFLEGKRQLFGANTLARSLRLTDMDQDDMATLKSGVFQAIPTRDRTGRPIIGGFEKLIPNRCYKRVENMVRSSCIANYRAIAVL